MMPWLGVAVAGVSGRHCILLFAEQAEKKLSPKFRCSSLISACDLSDMSSRCQSLSLGETTRVFFSDMLLRDGLLQFQFIFHTHPSISRCNWVCLVCMRPVRKRNAFFPRDLTKPLAKHSQLPNSHRNLVWSNTGSICCVFYVRFLHKHQTISKQIKFLSTSEQHMTGWMDYPYCGKHLMNLDYRTFVRWARPGKVNEDESETTRPWKGQPDNNRNSNSDRVDLRASIDRTRERQTEVTIMHSPWVHL